MKYKREIKVALLAIVCGCLVYFGFYFLKGVNVFSSTTSIIAQFDNVSGLTEQAPVYVRGYKVGQVDHIYYDFQQPKAFSVQLSINDDIALPYGTKISLISDGLLGGKAIEVMLPIEDSTSHYQSGDTLPEVVVPGLTETLQEGLLLHLDSVILQANALIEQINSQLEGEHVARTLANVDAISSHLTYVSGDLQRMTQNQIPQFIGRADTLLAGAQQVIDQARVADIGRTIGRVDSLVYELQHSLNQTDGTVGMLLNDKELYAHIDSVALSLDLLLKDIQSNPKRYINISVFGK